MAPKITFSKNSQKYWKLTQGETPVIDKKMAKGLAADAASSGQAANIPMPSAAAGATKIVSDVSPEAQSTSFASSLLDKASVPQPSRNLRTNQPSEPSDVASNFWETEDGKSFLGKLISGGATDLAERQAPPTTPSLAGTTGTAKGLAAPKAAYIPPGLGQALTAKAQAQLQSRVPSPVRLPQASSPDSYIRQNVQAAAYRIAKVNNQQNVQATTPSATKQPRYYFGVGGNPYYTDQDKSQQIATIQDAYKDNPIQQFYEVQKYKLFDFLGNIGRTLGGPATGIMESATTTPGGALVNFAYNIMMESGANVYQVFANMLNDSGAAKGLQSLSDQINNGILDGKYSGDVNTPHTPAWEAAQAAKNYSSMAQGIQNAAESSKVNLRMYQTGVQNSWGNLVTVTKNWQQSKITAPPSVSHPWIANEQSWKDYVKEQQQVVDDAQALSKSFAASALTKYTQAINTNDSTQAQTLANDAIDAQVKKLEEQRKTYVVDPFQSYTWDSQPDKYTGFMRDVAFFELQKGSDATVDEVQRIKDYWVNPWTDGIGQAIFDPLWMVPAEPLEMAIGALKVPAVKGLELARKIEPFDNAYRLLFSEAHTSEANRMGRIVFDTLGRIKQGYGTADEFMNGMDDISKVVLDYDRAKNAEEALQIFTDAKTGANAIPGLQNINYDDFQKLVSSFKSGSGGYLIDPTAWAETLRNGRDLAVEARKAEALRQAVRAGESIEDALPKIEREAQNYIQNIDMSSEYVAHLQNKVEQAYLDPFRAFPKSRLLDDTLSGFIAKKAAEAGNMDLARLINDVVGAGMTIRNVWTTAVLNLNPARIVRNLVDSMFRDVVYGGNIWDDIHTLFTNTHSLFASDVGFIPVEFGQSLARVGLDFDSTVPSRLLYHDWKPQMGILSYWDYERNRLLLKGVPEEALSVETAKALSERMAEGQSLYLRLWNGAKTGWENAKAGFQAIPGALADYNTAIEFTLRLRMFHREYFNLMRSLEPEFMSKGMDELSPLAKQLAKDIWSEARGNPSKISALVDDLSNVNSARRSWSFTLPEDFGKGSKWDATTQDLLTNEIRQQTRAFVEDSYKATGHLPTPEDIDKFTGEMKTGLQNTLQEQISNNWTKRETTTEMGKLSDIAEQPSVSELNGSAPIQKAAPAKAEVAEPIKLKRGQSFIKKPEVLDNYTKAISPFANVERISGGGYKVIEREGETVIQLGDDLLKGKTSALYDAIHNATVDSLFQSERDFVFGSGFRNQTEYRNAVTEFLADPLKVRNNNEQRFVTLVRQMERNPEVYDILTRTGKNVQSYFEAAANLRKYGYLDYVANMSPNEFFGMLENADNIAHPKPPELILSGDRLRYNTGTLNKLATELPEEQKILYGQIKNHINDMEVLREKYEYYTRMVLPGPKAPGVVGDVRAAKWDEQNMSQAAEYLWEAEMKNGMIEQIKAGNFDNLSKDILERNQDPTGYFLKENGFDLKWDENHQHIISGSYMKNGKPVSMSWFETTGIEKAFYKKGGLGTYNPLITIDEKGIEKSIEGQIIDALSSTLGMSQRQAGATMRVLKAQADRFAELTGESAEKYWSRIGFERIGNEWQLARTGTDLEALKKGIIIKDPNTGRMMFYGSGTRDTAEFVHQSAQIFYNDWMDIAKVNPDVKTELDTLNNFLGVKSGEIPTSSQLQKFADTFISYIANGKAPDIALKRPFESLRETLSKTFEGILGQQNLLNLPDDVVTSLDRMFTKGTMMYPPSSQPTLINTMAKQAGVDATDADLLKVINEGAAKPVTKLEDASTQQAADAVQKLLEQHQAEYDAAFMKADPGQKQALASEIQRLSALDQKAMTTPLTAQEQADFYLTQTRYELLVDEINGVEPRLKTNDPELYYHLFPEQATVTSTPNRNLIQKTWGDLEDAYRSATYQFRSFMAHRNGELKTMEQAWDNMAKQAGVAEAKPISQEVQNAFDTWKTRRDFVGFPTDALQNPDTLRAYLKDRIMNNWDDAANTYSIMLWDLDHFQNAVVNYHSGMDLESLLFPKVQNFQMSTGIQTWIRNNILNVNDYESAIQEINKLNTHLKSGDAWKSMIPDEIKAELQGWKDGAVANKADLVSLGLNGGAHNGHEIEGSISKVNRVMLDYNYRNRLDNFMRNFFPFWIFPSRSWPFWAEALSTHPEIVAAYQKIRNMSMQFSTQRGAVTASGQQLPSLEGYVPVPGTDLWVNPLAPLSFTYVLGMNSSAQDVLYQATSSQQDVPPQSWLAKDFMDMSPVYGFSVAPWISYLIKKSYGISDDVLPSYPLVPQISLMPRWAVADLIDKANHVSILGQTGWGDAIYPEVSWHDFLVERQMLENAQQKIQNMNEADAMAYVNSVAKAIQDKGDNQMWRQAYEDYTTSEASRSQASFITGFYTKPFGTLEADLLAVRNHNNLVKSALNNRFQTALFDLPIDSEEAWTQYLNTQNVPEGWLYRLYTDIGYVRNDAGQVVVNPQERAKYLAQKITQDENQSLYYQKLADAQKTLTDKLNALGVGAPYDKTKSLYDDYYSELNFVSNLNNYVGGFGTNKPVSLIQQDLENKWWRELLQTKPRWNVAGGETYEHYQAMLNQWNTNLPLLAKDHILNFVEGSQVFPILQNLRPDQKLDPNFFINLVSSTNVDGLGVWQKKNDTIFDALNNAWNTLYYQPYWEGLKDPTNPNGFKKGAAATLAVQDFASAHPQPPTVDEMYNWMIQNGYTQFSRDDVEKWVNYDGQANTWSMEQRLIESHGQDYPVRQDIWDMLGEYATGENKYAITDSLSVAEQGLVNDWYNSGGTLYATDPQKLQDFHDRLQSVIMQLGLQPPTRDQLVELAQAQDENKQFQDLVSKALNIPYTAAAGEPSVSNILDVYYQLGGNSKYSTFRKLYPQDLQVIEQYSMMKDIFGRQNPVWAKYYLAKTYGPGVVQPLPAPPTLVQPGTSQPIRIELYNGVPFPSGMTDVIGPDLSKEIVNKYEYGKNVAISYAGVKFLRALSQTHPDWKPFIDTTLSLP